MKNANICFTVLLVLLILSAGFATLNISSAVRYAEKESYERSSNRYITESGITLAEGLFLNYLDSRSYALSYEDNGGEYSSITGFTPFLLDEISEGTDESVRLPLIENEAKSVMADMGFRGYRSFGDITVSLETFGDADGLKLANLCREPDFLIGHSGETGEKRSKIKPVYLTVISEYKGGRVMCNMKIDGLYLVRGAMHDLGGETLGSVSAYIDTSNCEVEYENYQSFQN